MNKRQLLTAIPAVAASTGLATQVSGANTEDGGMVELDDVRFEWHHEHGFLRGKMTAPTSGWIAAGFNQNPDLKNTRFVIGATSIVPIRVEEHLAIVPHHRDVGSLGYTRTVTEVRGYERQGVSIVAFSLPHTFPDGPELDLTPGGEVTLMLAWSHTPDFRHHSTWRRHTQIIL
ncbi:MAG: DOMON domain-containing protein [Pseudomonadota bacterium]